MRIEKLDIRGFGKIGSRVVEFSKAFNIVYGCNESGKTTIQSFIRGMLFGLKSGRAGKDGTLPPSRRYKPWSSDEYSGFLEYRLDNGAGFKVGRNFSNNSSRVFDSLFNDITSTFEMSRDRGVLFAERQLGINDNCFDKTVFIRQMEARVGDEGSRELLNKLVNVSQTGFEDVSFIKAREALMEALKNHVGTDKTSTRPLDKVTARLNELDVLKNSMIEKRNSMYATEQKLGECFFKKKKLEKRKELLKKKVEYAEIKEKLELAGKKKAVLEEILEQVEDRQNELEAMNGQIAEYEGIKEQLSVFSSYTLEDTDDVSSKYQLVLSLNEDCIRLRNDASAKRQQIADIENRFENVNSFTALGDNIEHDVLKLNKELEQLRADYEKNNINVLNERIKSVRYKNRSMNLNIFILMIFSAALLSAAFFNILGNSTVIPALYTGACALIVPATVLIFIKARVHKEYTELNSLKKVSFISINSTIDEIDRKRKAVENIFQMTGAASMEEFIRLKNTYDNLRQQLAVLNNDINSIESELASKTQRLSAIRNGIYEMLFMSGVLEDGTSDITEEHIAGFKYGVRKYQGLEPGINLILQRTGDLQEDLGRLFEKASEIGETSLSTAKEMECAIADSEDRVKELEKLMNAVLGQLETFSEAEDGDREVFLEALRNMSVMKANDLKAAISDETVILDRELNETLLKEREYETVLRGSAASEDELGEIDMEIGELTIRKTRLEEANTSLRTAITLLTEASNEIQRDFAPVLNVKMGNIISSISQGRYSDLRADDELNLKVTVPETGDVVSVPLLSGGTIDQMYLALRIAMAELVDSTGEKLPLIMDEVFAQYDDMRTRETMEFLNRLSGERQIILFTCKKREVDIAKELCSSNVNLIEL